MIKRYSAKAVSDYIKNIEVGEAFDLADENGEGWWRVERLFIADGEYICFAYYGGEEMHTYPTSYTAEDILHMFLRDAENFSENEDEFRVDEKTFLNAIYTQLYRLDVTDAHDKDAQKELFSEALNKGEIKPMSQTIELVHDFSSIISSEESIDILERIIDNVSANKAPEEAKKELKELGFTSEALEKYFNHKFS